MRFFVLGLLIGCAWLQTRASLPTSPAWLAIACALPTFLVGARLRVSARVALHRLAPMLLLVVSGVAFGVGYAQWRAEQRLAEELPHAWEGVDIELIGAIASLPAQNERGTRFDFAVERVMTVGAVVPPRLSLSWYHESDRKSDLVKLAPTLTPGERWRLTVRLRRPHGTANPSGFDFEAWALERNIRATGYVRTKSVNAREATAALGFMFTVDRLRLAIRDRMRAELQDQPYAGVLIALVIGEQNAIPAEQWKVFWRTGTGHLMSISGLHITMVAAMFYWLTFRVWARVPRIGPRLALWVPSQRAAAVVGAATALAYSLVAGFSVPTQRTFFMLAAVALALLFGRGVSASRILAFALFAVLLIDPWAVLGPGFWLSFGAVAMILFVHAHRIGRPSGWSEAITTQAAVTLGLLPLTLALFQEVSMISPLANALAIPVVSLAVVPLALGGAALSLIGPFGWLLQLAQTVMSLCYTALAFLAELPGAVWQSHTPQGWTVALAILGVVMLALPRGVPLRAVGLIAMLPMFLLLPPRPRPGEMWVTLLDVGQGLATVVRTANHALVYDTGPKWNPDADSGNRIVVPYLRGEGIRELDALVVTHADEDHSGGARSIIDARNPVRVMTSVLATSDFLKTAKEVQRCELGNGWNWDGVDFAMLHPHPDAYAEKRKTNNLGCVLKISAPGGSILMTADIEKLVENELLKRDATALRADLLVVPHHGSRTSSSDAFIDAVAPKLALIAVGYRSRYRHPNAAVVERYRARGIALLRTDLEGAITIKFSAVGGETPQISRYRRDTRRYWTDLSLDDAASVDASGP